MSQGRHTPLTSKRRRTFLNAIAAGQSVETAARAVGVSRWTAYQWRTRDPTLRDEWDAAVESSTDSLEQKLYEMARGGDVTALIFMLRSRKAAVYNPNLLLRQAMLQLALEKARAEAGTALTIEGQAEPRPVIYPIEARSRSEDESEPVPLEIPRLLRGKEPSLIDPDDMEEDAA